MHICNTVNHRVLYTLVLFIIPCSIQKVLTGSQEEIDTLVENYQSTSQLASFLVVLRKDYDVLKAKKSTLQKEKNVLSQELLYLKRKVYLYSIP